MKKTSKLLIFTFVITFSIGLLGSVGGGTSLISNTNMPWASGEGSGLLEVTVKDQDGNSITDNHGWVKVMLYSPTSNLIGNQNLTGVDYVSFGSLITGTHRLEVYHPSYETVIQNVEIIDGQMKQITINLQPPEEGGEGDDELTPGQIAAIAVGSTAGAGAAVAGAIYIPKYRKLHLPKSKKFEDPLTANKKIPSKGFEDPLTANEKLTTKGFEDPLTANKKIPSKGFEDPLTANEKLTTKGFEDPLTANKKIPSKGFEDPLTANEKLTTKGFEDPLTANKKIPSKGFEDPLTANEKLTTKGFEDPLTANKKVTSFEDPLTANKKGLKMQKLKDLGKVQDLNNQPKP